MVLSKSAFIDFTHLKGLTGLEQNQNLPVTLNADGSVRSRIFDVEWNFKGVIASGLKTQKMVSFKAVKHAYRPEIQLTLFKIITYKKRLSVSSISKVVSSLVLISTLLGHVDWSKLDDDLIYREFCTNLKAKKNSFGTMEHLSGILKLLFILGLTGRNIGSHKKFGKDHSCEKKRNSQQTIALPESIMNRLYGTALDYIDRYYSKRYEISRANQVYLEIQESYRDTRGNIKNFSLWFKRNHPKFNLDLVYCPHHREVFKGEPKKYQPKKLTQTLQEACLIVLCGFSAARIGEVLSFTKKSYQTIEFEDITVSLLLGYSTKPQSMGKKKREVYPTHPITKNALALAYDMSMFARKIHRSKAKLIADSADKKVALEEINSTFISLDVSRNEVRLFLVQQTADTLQNFAEMHDITATSEDVTEYDLLNPTRKGELKIGKPLPSLGPHTCRRTFAVFLKRNKLGDLLTLRYATKHKNLGMAAWYTNNADLATLHDYELDSELMDMVQEANEQMFAEQLFYIYNEAETLSGGEGERILAARNTYQGTLYMSYEEILSQVKSGAISMVELPTGFCTKQNCDRTCTKPDCPTKIVSPEKALEQKALRERLIKKFTAYNTGEGYRRAILQKFSLDIESIEKTLAKHNIVFEPFTDEIV